MKPVRLLIGVQYLGEESIVIFTRKPVKCLQNKVVIMRLAFKSVSKCSLRNYTNESPMNINKFLCRLKMLGVPRPKLFCRWNNYGRPSYFLWPCPFCFQLSVIWAEHHASRRASALMGFDFFTLCRSLCVFRCDSPAIMVTALSGHLLLGLPACLPICHTRYTKPQTHVTQNLRNISDEHTEGKTKWCFAVSHGRSSKLNFWFLSLIWSRHKCLLWAL